MKTMKKFAALMMLLCALMICTIPALAANESGSDSNVTETVSVHWLGSGPVPAMSWSVQTWQRADSIYLL